VDWPAPKTTEDTIATVKRMMYTPRKFGVYLTKPEIRALEWAHALHDEVAARAQATAEKIKEAAEGLGEELTIGEVSSEAGGG
jgi:hypothetical protein